MILDISNLEENNKIYDVAIVGSGAVGLTMAVYLSGLGKSVIVLEAGPKSPSKESQSYFQAANIIGHEMPGIHHGRFRCMGGTTNFWGGQLVQFDEHIFDRPAISGMHNWPIGYEDINPYYKKVLTLLDMENIIMDDNKISDFTGASKYLKEFNENIDIFYTRWIPETNFAILYKDILENNKNIDICLNAQVVSFESSNREVASLKVMLKNGSYKNIKAHSYTLANGTTEIIRFLQNNKHKYFELKNSNWLGRAFFDHIDCYAGEVKPINKKAFFDIFDNIFKKGFKYSPKLKLTRKIQNEKGLLDIAGHFVFKSSASHHIDNIKILVKGLLRGRVDKKIISNFKELILSFKFIFPMAIRYIKSQRIMSFSDRGIFLRLTSEQRPLIESQISLRDDIDYFGMRNIDIEWKIDKQDIETIAFFSENIKQYLEKNKIASVDLSKKLLSRDPSFIDELDDANHQMGGVRMGLTSQDGVVDVNCKLFDFDNFYVCGACLFPSSGFPNPTFTAMALGIRLADHLYKKNNNNE